MSAPATYPIVQKIAIGDLDPNPWNPPSRTADVSELAADVKEHGILQPIQAARIGGRLTVIFGSRRFAAAKAAGLDAVPVMVRSLTEAEARELHLVENIQRRDLHPLDEASQLQILKAQTGGDVDVLARKVGKTRAHVQRRLALLDLSTRVRDAFYAGRIGLEVALLLARIPDHNSQDEILEVAAAEPQTGREALAAGTVREIIDREFTLRLDRAPFDRASLSLYPEAGSCDACPKRSGNQASLFGEGSAADLCTDRSCFHEKRARAWDQKIKSAEGEGVRVLEGKDARRVFSAVAPEVVSEKSGFVELDHVAAGDRKQRTYRQIVEQEIPKAERVVARDPKGGVHELAPREVVIEALRKHGHAGADLLEKTTPPDADLERKKREAERAAGDRLYDKISQACGRVLASGPGSREVLEELCHLAHAAAGKRAVDDVCASLDGASFAEHVKKATPKELTALAFALLIFRAFTLGKWDDAEISAGRILAALTPAEPAAPAEKKPKVKGAKK